MSNNDSEDAVVVSSVAMLLECLRDKRAEVTDRPIWFRGQGKFDWGLRPTLYRPPYGIRSEKMLGNQFKLLSSPLFVGMKPGSNWEWLFAMQHYGMPTRLLDWTEDPLVGLYFAVSDPETRDEDAALWGLSPVDMNRNVRRRMDPIPHFHDAELEEYEPSGDYVLQLDSIPIAAFADRSTPRIIAQSGTFVIYPKLDAVTDVDTCVEFAGSTNHAWRYRIPAADKPTIQTDLENLGVHALRLFPELDKVAERAKRDVDRMN